MRSAADKYNYRFEYLYAGALAILFITTIGLKVTDRFQALPVSVLPPKEIKKKAKEEEEEMTKDDSVLLVKATPNMNVIDRATISDNQRIMILRWAKKNLSKHQPQISLR